VQWRPKRDLTIGLDGEIDYRRMPTTTYRQWTGDERTDSEVSQTDWRASIAVEVYRYLKQDSPVSPFLAVSPFVARSHSKRTRESIRYEVSDTLTERVESSIDQTRYGIDLNWGGELFFRLSKAKMGLRLKSTLISVWRSELEHQSGSDYRTHQEPLGLEVRLPTEGNYSLWLCFYF
jgi:hypothetical protein